MAVCKVMVFGQNALLTVFSKFWCGTLRSVSQKVIKELLGYPEKPRKPINPFLRFAANVRPEYASHYGQKTEVLKIISKEWNEMPPNKKEKYFKDFEKEMEIYKEKLQVYNNSLTLEQKNDLIKLKSELKKSKIQDIASKLDLRKSLKKPTIPASTFIRFCLASGYAKGKGCTENVRALAEKWKKLPENEKKKYKSEYEKDLQIYKSDIEKWEVKMIQEGNINAIRIKTLRELQRSS